MSAKLKTFLLTLSAVVFLLLPETRATHIVGGDMTYRCLGDNYFEITLTFTRDCEYGADDARFDNFAIVSIYDQYFNPVNLGANGMLTIPYTGDEYIQTSLEGDCEVMGYEVCVHQSVYRDTVFLLPKDGGYILSYQRCCRNSTLKNIVDPLETGSTQMIHITEEAMQECNSSPVFNNWPDIYICTGRSIDFDHSATDPDGDSLVYKLFTPYQGAGVKNPRPDRFDEFDVPYEKLEWGTGYGESDMLGSAVPLSIDPNTGLITGIPEVEGQYVVGIMVEEYRDGTLLSTVRRDFEYNVRLCLDPPVADFEVPEVLCGSDEFSVDFINTSQNADSYVWYFEYPEIDKTSIEENPTYIYFEDATPTGRDTFNVYLKAIRDSDQCYDTIIKQVVAIEDDLIADFSAEIEDCPGDSLDIHLSDLSVPLNPFYNINEWNWTVTLEDGSTLSGLGLDYYITIAKQKLISVLLEIGSEEGCTASIEKQVDLIFVELSFIADPIAYCIGDSSKLVANPNSAWTYTWDPEDGLSFEDPADKSDPWCHIDHDTTYYVTVTDGVCTLEDSVHVVVQDYLDISIDGPEYVCNDSITLIALGGEPGVTIFEWAENDQFDPVIAEGDTVSFYINGWVKDYYLRVKEGTGCSNTIDSFHAVNNAIDMDYETLIKYCFGTEKEITLTNNRPGDTLVYTWEDSPYIVSALDSNVVTIYSDAPGEFDLVFYVVNQYGCELTDTIRVVSSEGPSLDMDGAFTCFTYTYCFNAFGGAGADYHWDFGVPDTEDDVSNEVNPCYDFPGPGNYIVSVSAYFEECGDTITLSEEYVVPEFFELMAQDTVGFCEGESVMLSVVPTNFSMDITWYNEANDSIGSGIMIEYTPLGDEWITVIGIDTFGCEDSVQIFLDMFEFDLTMDNPGTYCRGDTLTFGVYNNSNDEYSYQWEDHPTILSALDQPLITVLLDDDHSYNVTVTSVELGCVLEKSIQVGVSFVEADIFSDTTEIVITKNVDLSVEGNFDPDEVTIEWSTGENTETINVSPTITTTYCVTVTDEFGCFDEDCVEITVIDPPCDDTDIFIPNAFSPNDDDDIPNNNDIFRVYGKYLEEVEMVIFNRWGEELFRVKAGPDEGGPQNAYWDGSYNGAFLGPDVYAYIIRVLCQDTDTHEAQGNVSIIK
jgi:gliding motility-associated-like protein